MIMDKIRQVLTKDKPKYDIDSDDYRLMLDSSHGQKVLAHLLLENHFVEEIETPEEMARRNVLVRILHHAGILTEKNIKLLSQKLLEVGRIGR